MDNVWKDDGYWAREAGELAAENLILKHEIAKLQQQVDAILNTEIDWHDGPLTVRDLGAVQKTLAAINNDQL